MRKKKKIKWYQKGIRYSIFFGILTLLHFAGASYIHYRFGGVLLSKLYYLVTIVFGILTLYWIWKDRRRGS